MVNMRNKSSKMIDKLNIVLLVIISSHESNQQSVDLIMDSVKNSIMNIGNIIESMAIDNDFIKTIDPSIQEDAKSNVPELIRKYGYKAEVHHVTTEDGYILQLHRISGGPKSPPRVGKKVALVVHGVFDSSAGVVLSGPHHALGFKLADNDYDVWLGNCRGNTYSTEHIFLSPWIDSKQFWSFSWHEMGYYDLPATIDYVLNKTSQSKLQYLAHSQGATIFFVMASERPEYNDKIEMMHALAPAVFLSNVISPPIRVIVPFLSYVQQLQSLGMEFIKIDKIVRIMAGEVMCRHKAPIKSVCGNIIFLVCGYDSDQMNSTLLPVIFSHTPDGISMNQLVHFGQGVNSGHFRRFEYSKAKNLLLYKRATPPDYNLKNVKSPVAVYHSLSDWLATPPDVQILTEKLPNVIKKYLVPHKQFNHIDFLWGKDAPTLVYDEILKTMNSTHLHSKP